VGPLLRQNHNSLQAALVIENWRHLNRPTEGVPIMAVFVLVVIFILLYLILR